MSMNETLVKCPQCNFDKADYREASDLSWEITCRCCGYQAESHPDYENGKCIGRTQQIRAGVGALCCYKVDNHKYTLAYLHTLKEWRQARQWLAEQLEIAPVDPTETYLTRWSPRTKSVRAVFGLFRKREVTAEELETEVP